MQCDDDQYTRKEKMGIKKYISNPLEKRASRMKQKPLTSMQHYKRRQNLKIILLLHFKCPWMHLGRGQTTWSHILYVISAGKLDHGCSFMLGFMSFVHAILLKSLSQKRKSSLLEINWPWILFIHITLKR